MPQHVPQETFMEAWQNDAKAKVKEWLSPQEDSRTDAELDLHDFMWERLSELEDAFETRIKARHALEVMADYSVDGDTAAWPIEDYLANQGVREVYELARAFVDAYERI